MQQFENANKGNEAGTQMLNCVSSRNLSESNAKNARWPENSTQRSAAAATQVRAYESVLRVGEYSRYYPSKGQSKQCYILTGEHLDFLCVVNFSNSTSGVNSSWSVENIFAKVVEQSSSWFSTLNCYILIWFAPS